MTPFLAPRSRLPSSHATSATPLSCKIPRTPTKSVHFEDEVREKRPPLTRSVSTGKGRGKRFHLRWKRQFSEPERKLPESSRSSEKPHAHFLTPQEKSRSLGSRNQFRTYSPPPSPASTRSAPTTLDRHHSLSSRHPPPSPLNHLGNGSGGYTGLGESRLDNVYDLYAVCNHSGTLSRGHYTAFCKNPADGRWYNYDDTSVQQLTDDQILTSGAYMLFYVRQSLLSQSPLGSSVSSQSSCSSTSHWVHHMPPFRLDLADFKEEIAQIQSQQQHRQSQLSQSGSENHLDHSYPEMAPRSRLGSVNSAVSAPPNVGGPGSAGSCTSPPGSCAATDLSVFTSPSSNNSVVNPRSLPYHPRLSDTSYSTVSGPPSYQTSLSSSGRQALSSSSSCPPARHINGRHQSLRLGRLRDRGAEEARLRSREEREREREGDHAALQRGYSFQRAQYHHGHNKPHLPPNATFQEYDGHTPKHFQNSVTPTRSIPSFPTQEGMTPKTLFPHEQSFLSPHIHLTSASNGHLPFAPGPPCGRLTMPGHAHGHTHPESCV